MWYPFWGTFVCKVSFGTDSGGLISSGGLQERFHCTSMLETLLNNQVRSETRKGQCHHRSNSAASASLHWRIELYDKHQCYTGDKQTLSCYLALLSKARAQCDTKSPPWHQDNIRALNGESPGRSVIPSYGVWWFRSIFTGRVNDDSWRWRVFFIRVGCLQGHPTTERCVPVGILSSWYCHLCWLKMEPRDMWHC